MASRLLPIVTLIAVAAAPPAVAQSVERISLETTVAIDVFRGDNAVDRPNIVVDITGTARLGGGWQLFLRPWFRQPRVNNWDKQIYQAFVRYERQGPVSVRVDTGYLGSPIGLALGDSSPVINPTIAGHSSYFAPMLPFDTGGPRVSAISSTYPLGSQLTVSGDRWDARAAVVSTTPTRIYTIGGSPDPHHTPVFEAGGGITPYIGTRFGVSFARGAYLTSGEITAAGSDDRMVTMMGVEGEFAFRYTKISGEFVRDHFDTPSGTLPASEWFIQGTQTLTPRLFAAARYEGVTSPVRTVVPTFKSQPQQKVTEATVGFRLTSDILLRGSYLRRLSYGRHTWDEQGGFQAVWARRWW